MKIRVLAVSVTVVVLGSFAATSTPAEAAAPVAAHTQCLPGTPSTAPTTTDFYDPAHPEFGPAQLPRATTVGLLLFGYQRFGIETEAQFAAQYRSGSSWIYPPDDGFLVVAGHPIEYTQTLTAGTEIDRFGYSGGAYLSPAHTLFTQRALPPQNLNTPTGTPVANYHLYCILRAFPVEAGPIAPWFQQLGLGIQYKLDASLLPTGSSPSVSWLLTNGYLVEENPAQ